VTFYYPTTTIRGMLYGSKSLKLTGTAVFYDKKNGFKAVVNMNSGKSKGFFSTKLTDIFTGKLFKVKQGT